ncbi:hypothetical protein EXS70_03520 [Candidatus Peribacteria bacterium]|nr:hypothetical protein [Candidatus Peribacteria bacterium]
MKLKQIHAAPVTMPDFTIGHQVAVRSLMDTPQSLLGIGIARVNEDTPLRIQPDDFSYFCEKYGDCLLELIALSHKPGIHDLSGFIDSHTFLLFFSKTNHTFAQPQGQDTSLWNIRKNALGEEEMISALIRALICSHF